MSTETAQDIRFPRVGHNYTSLPRGKDANRVQAHAVQTIDATSEQIYNVYTRIELLPTWQEGVVAVERTGEQTLHWQMQDPGTRRHFEFDSKELEAVPGKRHVARITSGPTAGTTDILTLEPHPAGRGTIATLVSDYVLPGGWVSHAVSAVVSRSPSQITIENLRHLKQLVESTEIPSVEGQPAGRRGISGSFKQLLLGENMPAPPGTSNRAKPQDMPRRDALRNPLSPHTLTILGLVAIPVVFGAVLWASLGERD